MTCRACGSSERFKMFQAQEMMLGLRQAFDYAECLECGTIQIAQIPPNLGDYYPKDYYSLATGAGRQRRPSWPRRFGARLLLATPGVDWITRALLLRYPFLHWARLSRTRLDSACLDVGCGGGRLLRRMQQYGFTNLQGVDPYAPANVTEPGFRIARAELKSVTGKFDLIILSHVLEHLGNPIDALTTARSLLAPGGTILARVPVAGSELAQKYGPHWYNLDPPRHLVIPSLNGMELIARQAGLAVACVEFDSIEESALMSENYAQDIPMNEAPRSSRAERNRLRREAAALNRQQRGDLAAFFLVVPPGSPA